MSTFRFDIDDCMEDDTSLEIKSLTSFLSRAGKIPSAKATRGTVVALDDKGKRRKLDDLMQRNVNLLVRDCETLAVSISGEVRGDGQEASQITIVATNPAQGVQQPDPAGQDKTKVVVRAHRFDDGSKRFLPAEDIDVVGMVLARWREVIEDGGTDIPLPEHAGYITTMLACCYQAQTEDVLEKYVNVLRTYIFTVAHNKMLRRFQSGTVSKNRSFLTFLTTEISDIVVTKWAEDLPFKHSSRPPEQNELKIIRACARAGFFSEYPELGLSGDEDTAPIYNIRGRKRFHLILSKVLREVLEALNTLQRQMDFPLLAKKDRHKEALDKLDRPVDRKALVMAAMLAVQRLTAMLGVFHGVRDGKASRDHSILSHHLTWLEIALNVQSCSPTKSKQRAGLPQDKQSQVPEDETDTENDNDDEISAFLEGLDKRTARPSDWVMGAQKWLELICLHATSIDIVKGRIRPGEPQSAAAKRESDLVTKSTFTIVDVQQGERERSRKSYATCLDELSAATPDDDFDQEAIKKLFDKYGKTDDWEKTDFAGSLHCEAIMLGLAVIASNTDDLSKHWLESNGIFAADTGLIQRFRKFVPLIPVTKRCCPTCYQLCHLMAEAQLLQGAKKLTAPGQHETWSSTALPPFTSKVIAEQCLRSLRTSAIERLRELQTIADAEGLSATSHSDSADPRDESTIMANSKFPEYVPSE